MCIKRKKFFLEVEALRHMNKGGHTAQPGQQGGRKAKIGEVANLTPIMAIIFLLPSS